MADVNTHRQKNMNKNPVDTRLRDENQDPSATAAYKGVRTSRLPVLIKSTRPQTVTDFAQAQTTKSKVLKRLCTKPVPFSLSQPRANRNTAGPQKRTVASEEPERLLSSQLHGGQASRFHSLQTMACTSTLLPAAAGEAKFFTAALASRPEPPGSLRSAQVVQDRLGPPSRDVLLYANPAHGTPVLQETCPSQRPPGIPTCPSPPTALRPSAQSSLPGYNVRDTPNQPVCTGKQLGTLSHSTAVDAGSQKTVLASENTCAERVPSQDCVQASQVNTSVDHHPAKEAGETVSFQPDPAALRSILENKGLGSMGHAVVTPRVFTCSAQRGSVCTPQRVPVKSQRGTAAKAGSASQFSPSAVTDTLQNRGSSIYLPQRVPVTKGRCGAVGMGAVTVSPHTEAESCRTPVVEWMPQRVPNTRPQSMRKLLLTHHTPNFRNTPRLRPTHGSSQELETHKEENVIQRLFEDGEQEKKVQLHADDEKVEDPQQHDHSEQDTGVMPLPQSNVDGLNNFEDKTGQDGQPQPFLQAPHRDSVIVFAQGHRLLRTAFAEKNLEIQQPVPGLPPLDLHTPRHATVQAEERPHRTCVTASVDLCRQPASATGGASKQDVSVSTAASALHHRIRALEEVLLDEECTMYTSRECSSTSLLRRCGNPVASTLDFKDSTFFVPIASSSNLSPPNLW